ncbi:hypothetical protein PR202_ga18924 [Eleusine coracana subsp. coracana]|uniref:Rx N-terminal domain-containing protein n=1 Tax=Eleusine coracana subsp. coracana TaxID=191504 RepID=A0AAV5CTA3_ELECO|nr:hypothetical protein PR202_ga18924 [Eleusine coracana subsp. coracana]
MNFAREVVVPAALSEILGRIFSCLVDNFPRPSSAGARDAHRRRLERLLGNIGSVVEEAEGRHITNLHLLNQLKSLTDAMYRGRFALEATDLDDIKNGSILDDDDADDVVDAAVTTAAGKRSSALSSPFVSAAKRARLILGCGDGATEKTRVAVVVEELEALTRDSLEHKLNYIF